jgi:hypothetical protein
MALDLRRRSLKNTPDPQLTSCAIALVVSTSGMKITYVIVRIHAKWCVPDSRGGILSCPPALHGHTSSLCVSRCLGTRPPEATTVAEHEFKLWDQLLVQTGNPQKLSVLRNQGVFLGGEAVRFLFGAGNTWAPQVWLPPKFHSCERDFNVLSGWCTGSRVPRLREPFVNYLVVRRVVLRCFGYLLCLSRRSALTQ